MAGSTVVGRWLSALRLGRPATANSADVFEAAREFENQGLLDQAILAYGRLADAGVAAPASLMMMAMLQRQIGQVEAAIDSLERATTSEPGNSAPLIRLGEIVYEMGRLFASADCMKAAAEAAVRWGDTAHAVETRVNLAAAYLRLERFDLAYTVARSLPDHLTDWWASTRHEGLARRRDAHRAALDLLGRRRGADPLSDDERLTLARGLMTLGRLRVAIAVCDELIRRRPEWDLLIYFKTDLLTHHIGPRYALAFLRANAHLPRGSKEFLGSELRLLHEVEAWQDILDRMAEDHEAEQFPHAHRAVMMAMLMLDRRAELQRYCLEWMRRSPEEITPAACIAFLCARTSGLADGSGEGRRPAAGRTRVHVVQFWNEEAVPHDVRHGMDSWRRLHPHWRHTVFDQVGAHAFLKERLGSIAADAFAACWHPAMMADFFRVGFLLANGGLYADADEVCLRPLDDALPDLDQVEILAPLSGGFPGFVDNSFIGARAGSRILQLVLDDMILNILSDAQAGRRSAVWVVTGPGALTRGVARYIGDKGADAPGMVFLPSQQHRTMVRTETDLAYKRDPAANWRIA